MLDDERRDAILDAAYVCFTRHGVRRSTMEDIARQAGISRPAVYQYVHNKEDAFRRLAARLLEHTLTQAREAANAPGTPTERLTAVLTAKLDLALTVWQDSPRHAAELLGQDTRMSAELVEAYNTTLRDLLADTLHHTVAPPRAVEFAELLMAFTRGLETDLTDPDIPRSRLRQGVELFVLGLDHPSLTTQEQP